MKQQLQPEMEMDGWCIYQQRCISSAAYHLVVHEDNLAWRTFYHTVTTAALAICDFNASQHNYKTHDGCAGDFERCTTRSAHSVSLSNHEPRMRCDLSFGFASSQQPLRAPCNPRPLATTHPRRMSGVSKRGRQQRGCESFTTHAG